MDMRSVLPAITIGAGLLAFACAPQESADPDEEALGSVDFAVSCSPEAQAEFNRAVALMHHMMYETARDRFGTIAELDPGCAMARWGVAMTLFQPLWPTRPGPETLDEGRALLAEARELGLETERERAYVEAAEAFFSDDIDYGTRLQRFEAAMERVHDAFPDDLDAAALHGLALLATAPASDRSLAQRRRAAEILRDVYERDPKHPGAIHYSIHAHDVEQLAEGGVQFARVYDEIAPSVPHALHMPTHIFVRTGEWDEVIDWNRQSANAALDFPAGDYTSHHYPHALDYLMYAYLQRAADEKARELLDELRARDDYQPTFISAYALAAMPARYALERRAWADAARLPVRMPESFPWGDHLGARALTHYARGIGAARSGDADGARRAVEALAELEAAAREAGDAYWARQLEIQRLAVSAWLDQTEGRTDRALERMRASAELDADTDKNPVTPGALLPPRELLGDMLLEVRRAQAALEAYEESLRVWPNRFHSIVGAARAAEAVGDREKARSYYGALLDLAADDADRPDLEEAESFLGALGTAAGAGA